MVGHPHLIVTRFAAEHPASVASLALISPGLFLDSLGFGQRLSRLPGMHRLIAWRVGDVIDRLDKAHLSHPDQFPDYNKRAREQLAFPGMGESFASTLAHFEMNAGDQWRTVGEHHAQCWSSGVTGIALLTMPTPHAFCSSTHGRNY